MSISRFGVAFFTFGLLTFASSAIAKSQPWQYGLAVDLSYANAFQSDDPMLWRSKVTTQRLNQFAPNMGMFYLRKPAEENSRWGIELGAQAGYDTDGQVPAEQRLPGYSILRYVSRANVSYLTKIGNGLTIKAGLMPSFIGFESLFAKDNPNYTRSWIADYSPYNLIGVGAQYPVNDRLSLSFHIVSDFDYLAYTNDKPKYGSQISWEIDPNWKLTQNIFAGPEQNNTDTRFWRYFSDTQLQWSDGDLMLALAYDVGTEKLDHADMRQTFWLGSALFSRWHIEGPWSLAIRPEIYWDKDGQMTGSQQLIKGVTATAEYKTSLALSAMILRVEYRFDRSTGPQGGFFRTGNGNELIRDQHLLFLSFLLTLDSP
ncbi:outer membrane beta-barrel protein [Methylomonas sp. MgM2]